MKTAEDVAKLIEEWSKPVHGYTKAELVAKIAEACMGWAYVYGAAGALCNPADRRSSYNGNKSRHPDEAEQIKKNCQVLNGKTTSCNGCKWYPGGCTRYFDCRGFTRWVLAQVGITLKGAGCTSQWNTASNWKAKGKIEDMPLDQVCVVFWRDKKDKNVMAHTGLYVGNGVIIHCSGEVKKGKISDSGWTDYAIPNGMEGNVPGGKPTLKKGDKGSFVTLMQTKLIQLGYDVGKTGADGKFGANTESGLKAFQKKSGLPVTGVCDDATWDALESGQTMLYTVTIQHVSKSVADGIIGKYGGTMKKE